jgi:hypothetical protein
MHCHQRERHEQLIFYQFQQIEGFARRQNIQLRAVIDFHCSGLINHKQELAIHAQALLYGLQTALALERQIDGGLEMQSGLRSPATNLVPNAPRLPSHRQGGQLGRTQSKGVFAQTLKVIQTALAIQCGLIARELAHIELVRPM